MATRQLGKFLPAGSVAYRNLRILIIGCLVPAFAVGCASRQFTPPTPEQQAAEVELQRKYPGYRGVGLNYLHAGPEAIERYLDLKVGLRICMGMWDARGYDTSWEVVNRTKTPEGRQAYFDLYKEYNPVDFNAEEWMDLLERGGLKYFTILTKHHDGFSMYDTKTRVKRRFNQMAPGGPAIEECDTAYSIMDTPFKRDIVKELCDAAHKRNIAIDLYFSNVDWYDADFRRGKYNPWDDPDYNRTTDPAGYARQVHRHREQIRELLTNYGKIDMLCLDMNWELPEYKGIEWPDMLDTIRMIRALQPEVMVRKRGVGAYGDYQTPEGKVPDSIDAPELKMPWMAIRLIAKKWAFDPNPENYRTPPAILEELIDCCSKGGNLMLTTGPTGKGTWRPEVVEILEYMGDWLKVNGEAIYKTRPFAVIREGKKIRFTRSKDNKYVYAISLQWPGKTFTLKSVTPQPGSQIYMLGTKKPLAWRIADNSLVIEIPEQLQNEANRPCKQAYAFKIEGHNAK